MIGCSNGCGSRPLRLRAKIGRTSVSPLKADLVAMHGRVSDGPQAAIAFYLHRVINLGGDVGRAQILSQGFS